MLKVVSHGITYEAEPIFMMNKKTATFSYFDRKVDRCRFKVSAFSKITPDKPGRDNAVRSARRQTAIHSNAGHRVPVYQLPMVGYSDYGHWFPTVYFQKEQGIENGLALNTFVTFSYIIYYFAVDFA